MKCVLFVCLFAAAVFASDTDSAFLELLRQYEVSQNSLNVTLVGSVFDTDATIYLPAGEPAIVGRPAIIVAFKNFFGSLASLRETLTTPMILHKFSGGYSKLVEAVTADNKCPVILPAVQTFSFNNATGLLSGMAVIYNTTDFGVQAACK